MPASFIRRFTKHILLWLNIALCIVFLLCAGLVSMSFPIAWLTGFAGLIIPYLILLLLLYLLFWLMAKPVFIFFSLISLAIGWKQLYVLVAFQSTHAFSQNTNTEWIRVASWNLRGFNGIGKVASRTPLLKQQIAETILMNKPDIICLQEFNQSEKENHISLFSRQYPYYFFAPDYQNKAGDYFSGCVIFSRWPIVATRRIPFADAESLLYADVVQGQDTFRVYTTHLCSFRFNHDDYEDLQKIGAAQESGVEASRNIFRKMRVAFQRRGQQALVVKKKVKESPYPVILCGDFNDVPNSFTYHQITEAGLQDAFIQGSAGIGRTYTSLAPTLRIDYILAGPQWKVEQFGQVDEGLSDHFLLLADLKWEK
jgi:endonuclease/exonuclease/phosphatase family metal-dependent hydrolase